MVRKHKQLLIYLFALLLTGVLIAIFAHLRGGLESQNMAERWTDGLDAFSQVSVFFPADQAAQDLTAVSNLEAYIDAAVQESAHTGSAHWIDAYSSGVVSAKAGKNADADTTGVDVIGVGNEFFAFHPLHLTDGNYLYQSSLRRNSAVLDENAAWSIFFSLQVTGMRFYLNDHEFVVQGVVKRENQRDVQDAYSQNALIYVNYDAMNDLTEDVSLSCYEAVIPSPFHHYARNMLLDYYRGEGFQERDGSDGKIPVEIVDNTARFSAASVFRHLLDYRKNGTAARAIAYPYWENAARMLLNRLSVLLLLILIPAAYLLAVTVRFAVRKYRRRSFRLKPLLDKLIVRFTYKNSV